MLLSAYRYLSLIFVKILKISHARGAKIAVDVNRTSVTKIQSDFGERTRRRGMGSLPMTLMWWLPVLVLLTPYLEPVIASIPPVRVAMSRTRVESFVCPPLASRKTRPGEI
jgi:hypothetical protein